MANNSKMTQGDANPETLAGATESSASVEASPWDSSFLTTEVSQYLTALYKEVNTVLEVSTRLSDDSPARLTAAMRYSLLASGKRLRPILALIAAELCGGNRDDVLSVCVALESIHT